MTNDAPTLAAARATKVLGEYDHSINIAENFVIVYGPNGVGKTKFLEMIKAATQVDGYLLSLLPFRQLELEYNDGTTLHVIRSPIKEEEASPGVNDLVEVTFAIDSPIGKNVSWSFKDDGFYEWARSRNRFEELPGGMWTDASDGDVISTDELRDIYTRVTNSRRQKINPLPDVLENFKATHAAFLIEAQRLEITVSAQRDVPRARTLGRLPRQPMSVSRISDQAEKLKALVSEAQTEHSKRTQQLDRTFPRRVLEAGKSPAEIDPEDIRQRYDRQNDFRSRIGRVASVPLHEEFSLPKDILESWTLRLLDIYLDDADQKLKPFGPLLEKIELLESIVNDRLLRKSLRVTAEDGLQVSRSDSGQGIPLGSLSSGEQHEIILMIDLLFNVAAGAVVLIDEPEISLHIAWQLSFIPDVKRIAEVAGFNFVVATHSPQIINDEWDQAVRLGPTEAEFA